MRWLRALTNLVIGCADSPETQASSSFTNALLLFVHNRGGACMAEEVRIWQVDKADAVRPRAERRSALQSAE